MACDESAASQTFPYGLPTIRTEGRANAFAGSNRNFPDSGGCLPAVVEEIHAPQTWARRRRRNPTSKWRTRDGPRCNRSLARMEIYTSAERSSAAPGSLHYAAAKCDSLVFADTTHLFRLVRRGQ